MAAAKLCKHFRRYTDFRDIYISHVMYNPSDGKIWLAKAKDAILETKNQRSATENNSPKIKNANEGSSRSSTENGHDNVKELKSVPEVLLSMKKSMDDEVKKVI